jgi:hypothetical protein
LNIGKLERRYGVKITIFNDGFHAERDGVNVASALTLDELEIALLMM